jgi:hypothetical protein
MRVPLYTSMLAALALGFVATRDCSAADITQAIAGTQAVQQHAPRDLFMPRSGRDSRFDLPELGSVQAGSLKTNSSLISLGLNSKGKPGLWLTKKLP